MSFISKIFSFKKNNKIDKFRNEIEKINLLEPEIEKLSQNEIKQETKILREKVKNNISLDEILLRAFALVREASKRTLNQRHFDEQLIGGMVIHQGKIAEMRTGEGKTLTSVLPAYLNALTGKGVHIITVNNYLAQRDAVWMGQIYSYLGLNIGIITDNQAFLYKENSIDSKEKNKAKLDKERDEKGSFEVLHEFLEPINRKEAYKADVLYGTNHAFGFDYLRDNLARDSYTQVGQGFNFAIIDEIDSVLIDEARTPLIISSQQEESSKMYNRFARLAPNLKENIDYNIDEKRRAVTLNLAGLKKVEEILGKNIYETGEIDLIFHLEQALKAKVLFLRDRDYVIKNGAVVIVDEFTGRLMPDRRFSEGLHQALEAKENVIVRAESKTVATVTLQNLFKKYKKLSGMTGTASTSAEELDKVYGLDVVSVPTHKEMQRIDSPDKIYKTSEIKWEMIVREIKERQKKGQPVLVGTVSVEKNEYLSSVLKKRGISFEILNAKNHEREGEIIAQAGKKGAVTVATNMAGRGVDIVLGGNPYNKEKAKEVRDLGGLFVLGTERHEARRIDNQLRGRAGRQGDPGETQFIVSLDDDLMRIFGGDKIKGLMNRFRFPEDIPINNRMISRAIERAQTQVEGFYFDTRKRLLEYDEILNKQRDLIYDRRQNVLENKNIKNETLQIFSDEFNDILNIHAKNEESKWNWEEIMEIINSFGIMEINEAKKFFSDIKKEDINASEKHKKLKEIFNKKVSDLYNQREKEIGKQTMELIDRELLLRSIDISWGDYIDSMEHLRRSVGLRAVGGKDPLIEYKIEAKRSFQDLLYDINNKVTSVLFKLKLKAASKQENKFNVHLNANHNIKLNIAEEHQAQSEQVNKKIGRNDPCSCGSDKKYKKCHGR